MKTDFYATMLVDEDGTGFPASHITSGDPRWCVETSDKAIVQGHNLSRDESFYLNVYKAIIILLDKGGYNNRPKEELDKIRDKYEALIKKYSQL